MTSRGCFRTQLRRSAFTPRTSRQCRKKRRVRSARTECSVRDTGGGTEADGSRHIEAERRSQRRTLCDHGFAHGSSPTRRGHRGKVSVSNLVQSQCKTLNVGNVQGRIVFQPASLHRTISPPCQCTVSASHFFLKHPSWMLEKFRHRTTALILL